VQHVTGPESCITPAATPAGNAVEDQPAVVGSHEASNGTGPIHLEIDDRAYETASITDTPDPDIVPSCGVQGPHQDLQDPGTWQRSTVPLSSANTDPILDPLVTTDDLLDKASYAPEAKYPQQAGEEDRTISTGSAAGSDQFGTRSLEPSERRTAEPLPYFYRADDSIWLTRDPLLYLHRQC
jgi:hypothetical protein